MQHTLHGFVSATSLALGWVLEGPRRSWRPALELAVDEGNRLVIVACPSCARRSARRELS